MNSKNTLCLWYDGTAEEAANFYAKTFPDSSVGAVRRAPATFPAASRAMSSRSSSPSPASPASA